MGWLFTDYCAGCGVSDDKEDLISINGTVYAAGYRTWRQREGVR